MKIIVYPIGENPYQDLLYSEFKNYKNFQIKYLLNKFIDTRYAFKVGMFIFPFRFLYHRLKGWNIIHLHWLSPFVLPTNNKYLRHVSSLYILSFLIVIKLLKFKLVWTLHETMPHTREFHNDKSIRNIVSKFSDAKIFHSLVALKEAKHFGFDTKNSKIIPHGNYNKAYENNISQEFARKKFKLNKKDFVFLFFGMIKPYKGLDYLLKSFETLLKAYPDIKLIIAGDCKDENLSKMIRQYSKKYKNNIIVNLRHVKDADVQYFFNASNITVLPFKKNTTSGSAILSLTFGKPIIAPLIGSFIDFPRKVGYFYNLKDNKGLISSMKNAYKNRRKLEILGLHGLKYSKRFSWDTIALNTKAIFESFTYR